MPAKTPNSFNTTLFLCKPLEFTCSLVGSRICSYIPIASYSHTRPVPVACSYASDKAWTSPGHSGKESPQPHSYHWREPNSTLFGEQEEVASAARTAGGYLEDKRGHRVRQRSHGEGSPAWDITCDTRFQCAAKGQQRLEAWQGGHGLRVWLGQPEHSRRRTPAFTSTVC